MDLLSVVFITEILDELTPTSLCELALTCHTAFQRVSPTIQSRCTFKLFTNLQEVHELLWYKPQNLAVRQVVGKIPESVKHLRIYKVNKADCQHFPSKLTQLRLIHNIRRVSIPLESLPSTLTRLIMSSNFNQPLHHGLQHLQALTHLKFKDEFNHPVDSLLPKNLTHLCLSKAFNQKIDHLPPHLVQLAFEDDDTESKFNQKVDHLPQTLTLLNFGGHFNQPVNFLPPKITHLKFGYTFNQDIRNLPQSITHLYSGNSLSMSIASLPANLELLVLSSPYELALPPVLPVTLTRIYFSYYGPKLRIAKRIRELKFVEHSWLRPWGEGWYK